MVKIVSPQADGKTWLVGPDRRVVLSWEQGFEDDVEEGDEGTWITGTPTHVALKPWGLSVPLIDSSIELELPPDVVNHIRVVAVLEGHFTETRQEWVDKFPLTYDPVTGEIERELKRSERVLTECAADTVDKDIRILGKLVISDPDIRFDLADRGDSFTMTGTVGTAFQPEYDIAELHLMLDGVPIPSSVLSLSELDGTTNWEVTGHQFSGFRWHTLTVHAKSTFGTSAIKEFRFKSYDNRPPVVDVIAPALRPTTVRTSANDYDVTYEVIIPADGIQVRFDISAKDTNSGIKEVTWALLNCPAHWSETHTISGTAVKRAAGADQYDWQTFEFAFDQPPLGSYDLKVEVVDESERRWIEANPTTDGQPNSIPPNQIYSLLVALDIAEVFKSNDASTAFSPRAYLEDLQFFATKRVGILQADGSVADITEADLDARLLQPIRTLVQSAEPIPSNVNRPVNQLRLALEVLYKHLETCPIGLAARWLLTDIAGVAALDTGHERFPASDGVLSGGPVLPVPRPLMGLEFSGQGDHVAVAPSANLRRLQNFFTVAMWVRPDQDIADLGRLQPGTVLGRGQVSLPSLPLVLMPWGDEAYTGNSESHQVRVTDHAGLMVAVGKNGIVVLERYRDSSCPESAPEQPTVHARCLLLHDASTAPLTESTHVAVVVLDRTPILYVGGAPVATSQGLQSPKRWLTAAPATIGGGPGSNFCGEIRDVSVFGSPLRDVDVKRLCQGSMPDDASKRWRTAESQYREEAYLNALQQNGTSFDEIRYTHFPAGVITPEMIAGTAPAPEPLKPAFAARQRLIARLALGATNDPTSHSRLDSLYMDLNQLTPADLADTFGVAELRTPVLTQRMADGLLLQWQLAALHKLWLTQDHPTHVETVVLDPDLMVEQDFKTSKDVAVATARAEYMRRRDELAKLRTEISEVEAGNTADTRAAALLMRLDLDDTTLSQLLSRRTAGEDIEPDLQAMQVSLSTFLTLGHLRELARHNNLARLEWNDIYDIVLQAEKRAKYPEWDNWEKVNDVALSPRFFNVTNSTDDTWQPVPWRGQEAERRLRRDVLKARIAQEQSVRSAAVAAVASADESSLPPLRDAYVDIMSRGDRAKRKDVYQWLLDQLFVDLAVTGRLQSTRLEQGIQVLQGALFALRAGLFPDPDWAIKFSSDPTNLFLEPQFDVDWQWMGSYEYWRSAIGIFAYPENVLMPSLWPGIWTTTTAFNELKMESARKSIFTPRDGLQALTKYLKSAGSSSPYVLNATRLREVGLQWDATDGSMLVLASGKEQYGPQLTVTGRVNLRCAIKKLFQLLLLDSTGSNADGLRAYERMGTEDFIAYHDLFLKMPLHIALCLHRSGYFMDALDWLQLLYSYDLPADQAKIYQPLEFESEIPAGELQYLRPLNWLQEDKKKELNPHVFAASRRWAYTRFVLFYTARCLIDLGDQEFTKDSFESRPRAIASYTRALEVLDLPELLADKASMNVFPLNPLIEALRRKASANREKISSGRNIAGMIKSAEPESLAQTDEVPAASLGQTVPRPRPHLEPTPYRYSVLVERAKALVSMAQQIETQYLNALAQRDHEAYILRQAGQGLETASATVKLHEQRIIESQHGESLALHQVERATVQRDTLSQWIEKGANSYERQLITNLERSEQVRASVIAGQSAMAVAQSILSAACAPKESMPAAAATAAVVATKAGALYGAEIEQMRLGVSSETATLRASWERRRQQWELERALAQKDALIAQDQMLIALDRTRLSRMEKEIAEVSHQHAKDMVAFLEKKFTSMELYEWMSGVLGDVYRYFLQQATSLALLAQAQLEFERHEGALSLVQVDYWDPPSDDGGNGSDKADRKGLTGSARLLRDITQLDQHAFLTDRRKQQLVETFSLSQLAPYEFQVFKESGRFPFTTSLQLFDQGLPGHYLRLIRRVRLSLIALVPPVRGIRATLLNSGISRIVTNGELYRSKTLQRVPESISFTSPADATGLFELDVQPEMRLPFEGLGVETNWELQLPKAANQFDFDSIADVLFTMEYTALNSIDYRREVIGSLDRSLSAERSFSVRNEFPDQWYRLHHREELPDPEKDRIELEVVRGHFPWNVDDIRTDHVLVYFAWRSHLASEVTVEGLTFAPDGGTLEVVNNLPTLNGVISTRRSGGIDLLAKVTGKDPLTHQLRSPVGIWSLKLSETLTGGEDLADLLTQGELSDVFVVFSFSGTTPPWPE